jgi:class 3 adenylate cyclase
VPGRILVSADSWRHLRGAFLGACRGTIAVKGRNDPIEVYEINPEPGTACWDVVEAVAAVGGNLVTSE